MVNLVLTDKMSVQDYRTLKSFNSLLYSIHVSTWNWLVWLACLARAPCMHVFEVRDSIKATHEVFAGIDLWHSGRYGAHVALAFSLTLIWQMGSMHHWAPYLLCGGKLGQRGGALWEDMQRDWVSLIQPSTSKFDVGLMGWSCFLFI